MMFMYCIRIIFHLKTNGCGLQKAIPFAKGDEQEKSRDRNYERTRRFQGRIAGNKVMFWRFL